MNIADIFKKLKFNAHGTSYCDYNHKITFGFNSLDNLIVMFIEAKKYTDNITVQYLKHSCNYNHYITIII